MTELARFLGIIVKLYYNEHHHEIPHVHVEFRDHVAVFSLDDLSLMEGKLPARQRKLVLEWMGHHQEALRQAWTSARKGQEPHRLPPLLTGKKKHRPVRQQRDPARRSNLTYPRLRMVEWLGSNKFRFFFGVGQQLVVKEMELPVSNLIAARVTRDGLTGVTAGFPYEWSASELYAMPGRWFQ